MFTISKTFEFAAAHQLRGLAPDHPCMREHGHNYKVTVFLRAKELDGHGFVVDYHDLAPIKYHIDQRLDHRSLNEVLPQPTAEHLAAYLLKLARTYFPQCYAVMVQETEKTTATVFHEEPAPDAVKVRVQEAGTEATAPTVLDVNVSVAGERVAVHKGEHTGAVIRLKGEDCPFGAECTACNPLPADGPRGSFAGAMLRREAERYAHKASADPA